MSKRYRRKIQDFELIDTRFDGLEAGPIVTLDGGEGTFDVPWAEFKADFEEVPAETEGDGDIAASIDLLSRKLEGHPDDQTVLSPGKTLTIRHLRIILNAARKSLAATPESAERCRVGEWLPVGYLPGTDPKAAKLYAVCTHEDADSVSYSMLRSGHLVYDAGAHKTCHWDAARDRWIADGRPTS